MNEAYRCQRARALDQMGLRQTSTGSCPRRLAGLPHRDIGCWCSSRLNDHGRRYRRVHDDRPVVLWEPYEAGGGDLAEVIVAASADGLHVNVLGFSPWNPGWTFCIAFIRESGGPDAA